MMEISKYSKVVVLLSFLALAAVAGPVQWDGRLVEWASMREAIGRGDSKARGVFAQLTTRPHFYGIGAVAGLKGEATVLDGRVVATEVSCCGSMIPVSRDASRELEGTFLLGTYVEQWTTRLLDSELEQLAFEEKLRSLAEEQSWKSASAFPFLLEGELLKAKIHVVNGACPMHARMNEMEVPEEKRAFEKTYDRLPCKVLGFFSDNSVGVRTHPGTSIHAHAIFIDPESGQEFTGHLERFAVVPGATLSLPR